MTNLKRLIRIIWLLFFVFPVYSQDTLHLTIHQADSIFVTTNFRLMAASMNVEASKAEIIQARLFPNPVLSLDLNLYDPENRKIFHVGGTGQKVMQFEQLIRLAGKRTSEIDLAKSNSRLAELEFLQLSQQLKFQLHRDLFALGQYRHLLNSYSAQLALLDTLLKSYQQQADLGNVPLKEVVRLKGAYLKLNNDRAEIFKQYYQVHSNLQLLLQTNIPIQFYNTEDDIRRYIKSYSLPDLEQEALLNRVDLKIAEQQLLLAQQFRLYQGKLAKPDMTVFSSYDQRGGAFTNQVNAGLSIPLPLFNRNQGNIKMAEYKAKEADLNFQASRNELLAMLSNNYKAYLQTVTEYNKAAPLYNQDFEITSRGMTDNFRKQNVSMIEFIDFFEAYNEVQVELVRIKSELVLAAEQLNLLIGKEIY